jgi:Asp-tRNA(Asn)/Glu-tRNA(Gln) amidotransferase A subunit family amidase
MKHIRDVARTRGVDHTLSYYDVDVIICPADSDIDEIVSGSGYPACTLPLGIYENGNGRPFGLVAVAGQWQEGLLVKVMSAWEATLGKGRKDADLAFVDDM